MKVIVGNCGTGKSTLLAEKVYEVTDQGKRALVLTGSLTNVFKRLTMVRPNETIGDLLVTIRPLKKVSDLIKFLIVNSKEYDAFFIDELVFDRIDMAKLSGFVQGSGLDMTITIQTNKSDYGNTVKVMDYDVLTSDVTLLEEYDQTTMQEKIRKMVSTGRNEQVMGV